MKASEKVKIGLLHCRSNAPCMNCPYYEFRDRKYTCEGYLMFAAHVYIQELEYSLDKAGQQVHEIAIMLQTVHTDPQRMQPPHGIGGRMNESEQSRNQ